MSEQNEVSGEDENFSPAKLSSFMTAVEMAEELTSFTNLTLSFTSAISSRRKLKDGSYRTRTTSEDFYALVNGIFAFATEREIPHSVVYGEFAKRAMWREINETLDQIEALSMSLMEHFGNEAEMKQIQEKTKEQISILKNLGVENWKAELKARRERIARASS